MEEVKLAFVLLDDGQIALAHYLGETRIPLLTWDNREKFSRFVEDAIRARGMFYPDALKEAEKILEDKEWRTAG